MIHGFLDHARGGDPRQHLQLVHLPDPRQGGAMSRGVARGVAALVASIAAAATLVGPAGRQRHRRRPASGTSSCSASRRTRGSRSSAASRSPAGHSRRPAQTRARREPRPHQSRRSACRTCSMRRPTSCRNWQTLTGGHAPDEIFLTHGHIGHYTGLMYLGRESIDAQQRAGLRHRARWSLS